MRLKKLVAACAAVTMLGSLVVAVPASAATEVKTVKDIAVNTGATDTINGTVYAYSNANTYIWYLGEYDITTIRSMTIKGVLCPKTEGSTDPLPELHVAYIDTAENIDKDYLTNNQGQIRGSATRLWSYKGKTQDSSGKPTSYDDFKDITLERTNNKPSKDTVKLILYAIASSRRAYMDTITIETDYSTRCIASLEQNGVTTYYEDMGTLYGAITGDATITLLKDATLTEAFMINSKGKPYNFTIQSEAGKKYKLTTGSYRIALETNKSLTFNNVKLYRDKNTMTQESETLLSIKSGTMNLNNCTVEKGCIFTQGGTLNLNNTTVDDGYILTRNTGATPSAVAKGAKSTIKLTNASVAKEVKSVGEEYTSGGNDIPADDVTYDSTSFALTETKYTDASTSSSTFTQAFTATPATAVTKLVATNSSGQTSKASLEGIFGVETIAAGSSIALVITGIPGGVTIDSIVLE